MLANHEIDQALVMGPRNAEVMRDAVSTSFARDSLIAGCDDGYSDTARAAALHARAKSVSFAALS